MNNETPPGPHKSGAASDWIHRWTHLAPLPGHVLDIACGHGRHLKWFSDRGHTVTGIDRSPDALAAAANYGNVVLADIENEPWPLRNGEQLLQFDTVLVTNYLWRPLFPVIAQSLAPGGLLLYETFAQGNETVGRPSRPDFLLQANELWTEFQHLQIIAFEQGYLDHPPRFVQRIAAKRAPLAQQRGSAPQRHPLA